MSRPISTYVGLAFAFVVGLAGARPTTANDLKSLSEAAADPSRWTEPSLRSAWRPQPVSGVRGYAYLKDLKTFRDVPVRALTVQFSEEGITECTTLLFFDAGYSYGFIPSKEDIDALDERTDEAVADEYQAASEKARAIIQDLYEQVRESAPAASKIEVGHGKKLKLPAIIAPVPGGAARLIDIPNRMVEISFFPNLELAARICPETDIKGTLLDRSYYASRVKMDKQGNVFIPGIPMLHQGNRAYCGVSTLAMAAQYFHLNLGTEAYAAAAKFKKGNKVVLVNLFDIYKETIQETGFELKHRVHMDFKSVKESVINGFPVLVWRRFDSGRDRLHSAFARRYARDPEATLPLPNEAERSTWPVNRGEKHASLITGYNEERGEVIFTEPWGEQVRNRRMRIEEMIATSYLSFYPY